MKGRNGKQIKVFYVDIIRQGINRENKYINKKEVGAVAKVKWRMCAKYDIFKYNIFTLAT